MTTSEFTKKGRTDATTKVLLVTHWRLRAPNNSEFTTFVQRLGHAANEGAGFLGRDLCVLIFVEDEHYARLPDIREWTTPQQHECQARALHLQHDAAQFGGSRVGVLHAWQLVPILQQLSSRYDSSTLRWFLLGDSVDGCFYDGAKVPFSIAQLSSDTDSTWVRLDADVTVAPQSLAVLLEAWDRRPASQPLIVP